MKALLLTTTAAILILATGTSLALPAGTPNAEKLGWRLACQAYSFNKFTFFEAVDKTAATGCKFIEAYPGQKLSPEKPDVVFDHNAPQDVLDAVKAKLAAAGVTLVNYGVVNGKDEAEWRKIFDFGKKMGLEVIVCEPETKDFDLVQKLVKESGIKAAFHNHPKPSKYWDPAVALAAFKNRDGMGSCADTGHWMRSGVQPLQALQILNGKIVSLHFKDLNEFGNKDAHDVVWGTGKADVKALLAELKKQNFKGVFSIEYEYNWENSVPEITQCVAAFDKFAAELAK